MKFQLDDHHRDLSDEDLLADVRRVSQEHKIQNLTRQKYDELGRYSEGTLRKRFGGWLNVLKRAGLQETRKYAISDEELFSNLERVWIFLGRQPKRDEMNDRENVPSTISSTTYEKRFGSWRNALEAFVSQVNSNEAGDLGEVIADRLEENQSQIRHKTKREISDRLRFAVLMRDGFTCQSCGASPTKERGCELHVDHIIPWSKGGETVESNLQTKCKKCNLGKGNAFNQ